MSDLFDQLKAYGTHLDHLAPAREPDPGPIVRRGGASPWRGILLAVAACWIIGILAFPAMRPRSSAQVGEPSPGIGLSPPVGDRPTPIVDRCPDTATEPTGEELDAMGKTGLDGALRADMRLLSAYGESHADTFGMIRYGWTSAGDPLMVITFAGPLDEHRAALAAQIARPESLVVCSADARARDLQAVRAEIERDYAGRLSGIGDAGDVVLVIVSPENEGLVAELNAKYGGLVDVRVGDVRAGLIEAQTAPVSPSTEDPA